MDRDWPEISVVIPTHNRRDLLLVLLDALSEQSLPPKRFEVIVALDSITDDSLAAISARTWPFALRTVSVRKGGAAGTRNAGAALARALRVVFIDDDVRPAPHCLEAHLEALGAAEERIVVGPYLPEIAGQGWFYEGLREWWEGRFADLARPGRRFAYTDLLTGNVSMSRALFERLGGFDETITGAGREDYEFGYRALLAGVEIAYAPEAMASHREQSDPARNLRRARAEGVADVAIARRHPEAFPVLIAAGLGAPTASSWVMRQLTFRAPGLVDSVLRIFGAPLPLLERLGLRMPWRVLDHWQRRLAYYAGVAEAAQTVHDLYEFGERASWWQPAMHAVELSDGIEASLADVEAARPDDCRILVGGQEVGRIPALPGFEPLRGRHLEAWLRDGTALWAVQTAAAERLPPLPVQDVPRPPVTGWSVGELDLESWILGPVRQPLSLPLVTLIRAGDEILGWVELDSAATGEGTLPALRQAVLASPSVCEGFLRSRLAPVRRAGDLPPISVVVCTRDRTENLAECLAALANLDYSSHEVIVVDNAPATTATARLVSSHPSVRYVREDRPGLDWARNAGIASARHGIIAFTDDDTRPDARWLSGIARAFEDPEVAVVTGLVAPMELATGAQRYFEGVYGGMGRGLRGRRWSLADLGPRLILWPSGCGVGANMAFRSEVLDRVGMFNPALDVGTATRGGGDIEMFHRVLAAGHVIQYAPQAMVWHRHRKDWADLAQQLTDNGSGSVAYLLTAWRRRTGSRAVLFRFLLIDWLWGWQLKRLLRPGRHHRDLVLREIRGMIRGPALARRARVEAARIATLPPPPEAMSCPTRLPEAS